MLSVKTCSQPAHTAPEGIVSIPLVDHRGHELGLMEYQLLSMVISDTVEASGIKRKCESSGAQTIQVRNNGEELIGTNSEAMGKRAMVGVVI